MLKESKNHLSYGLFFLLLLHLSCRFDLTRPISMWQQRRRQQQHKNQKQKRKNRKCIKLGSAWSSKHSENNLMAIWPLCFDSKCFFSLSLYLWSVITTIICIHILATDPHKGQTCEIGWSFSPLLPTKRKCKVQYYVIVCTRRLLLLLLFVYTWYI